MEPLKCKLSGAIKPTEIPSGLAWGLSCLLVFLRCTENFCTAVAKYAAAFPVVTSYLLQMACLLMRAECT